MTKFLQKLNVNKLAKCDKGQALVLVSVGMLLLMVMAGLGVDVGYLHYQKHQMQKAADSAALAGAEALNSGDGKAGAIAAANSDATVNGFLNGSNGITVTVNIPPVQSPAFKNKSGYVEVIVAQPRPSFFMKAAGWGNVNVASRAVATTSASGSGCIYSLDNRNQKAAMELNGTVSISSSCGVYVDSTNSDALDINGNSGVLNAGTAGAGIGVVGGGIGSGTGWLPNGGPYCTSSGFCPQPANIAHVNDPLLNVAEPAAPTDCVHPPPGPTDFYPGNYCAGIDVETSGNFTFHPGLYVVCNGFKVGGSAAVHGTGVTFFITGNQGLPGCTGNGSYGPVTVSGSSGSSLSAPTSGSGCTSGANGGCPGILFFQDRRYVSTAPTDTSSIDGTNNATYSGALYFPGTNLKYAGNPNADVASLIIGWDLTFSGTTQINNNLLDGGGSPLTTAALAE